MGPASTSLVLVNRNTYVPDATRRASLTLIHDQTNYTVLLDYRTLFTGSATASAAQYNALLYSATSLDTTKEHQVVMVNSQGSLDIDYMIITAGDGNSQYVRYPVILMYAH